MFKNLSIVIFERYFSQVAVNIRKLFYLFNRYLSYKNYDEGYKNKTTYLVNLIKNHASCWLVLFNNLFKNTKCVGFIFNYLGMVPSIFTP